MEKRQKIGMAAAGVFLLLVVVLVVVILLAKKGKITLPEKLGKVLGITPGVASGTATLPGAKAEIDLQKVAQDVIAGKYGNEPERSARLRAAGYDPVAVQALVNSILSSKPQKAAVSGYKSDPSNSEYMLPLELIIPTDAIVG